MESLERRIYFGIVWLIECFEFQKEDSEYWSRKRLNVVPKDETPLVSGAKRSSEPSMGETSKSEGDTGGTGKDS